MNQRSEWLAAVHGGPYGRSWLRRGRSWFSLSVGFSSIEDGAPKVMMRWVGEGAMGATIGEGRPLSVRGVPTAGQ